MDTVNRRLLESKFTASELLSLDNVRHPFSVNYVSTEAVDGSEFRYNCVKDLRSVLISAAISARVLTGLGDFKGVFIKLMGIELNVDESLLNKLNDLVYGSNVEDAMALGYGDIAIGNILCKRGNTQLLNDILCTGYGVPSTRIDELAQRSVGANLTREELETIPYGYLFVKSVDIPAVGSVSGLRISPSMASNYENSVREMKDLGCYAKILSAMSYSVGRKPTYIMYRDNVAKILLSSGIEVVDSLNERPKIVSSVPIIISYEQLEGMFLHYIIDMLTPIY